MISVALNLVIPEMPVLEWRLGIKKDLEKKIIQGVIDDVVLSRRFMLSLSNN